MSSVQRTTFLSKLTVQTVCISRDWRTFREEIRKSIKATLQESHTIYIPYKSCATHVTQKDRAFLWQPIWRAYKKKSGFSRTYWGLYHKGQGRGRRYILCVPKGCFEISMTKRNLLEILNIVCRCNHIFHDTFIQRWLIKMKYLTTNVQ